MSDKPQPIDRVGLYPVNIAIWRNENEKGEVFYGATVENTFKDKEGSYQSSRRYSAYELLLLAKAADLAHTKIIQLRALDRAAVIYE